MEKVRSLSRKEELYEDNLTEKPEDLRNDERGVGLDHGGWAGVAALSPDETAGETRGPAGREIPAGRYSHQQLPACRNRQDRHSYAVQFGIPPSAYSTHLCPGYVFRGMGSDPGRRADPGQQQLVPGDPPTPCASNCWKSSRPIRSMY